MCLACEMDALWFAEMEAAAGATPGTAGVPPAVETAPAPGSPERAGGTPAVVGGVPPTVPSRFHCEETGS
jgi:hypothetical protein